MNNSHAYTQYSLKPAYALSLIIGLLMAVVSLAGLLFPGSIYPTYEQRDSFLANEVVNLIIGLPVLLGSMWLARGGSLAGLLLWPGALLYILYNYIAYTIGMPLSWISIFYLALVILSAYGLFDLLRNIDKNSVRELLSGVVPIKTAGWVLAVLGSLFILRALNMIVQASMDHITLPTAEIGVLIADMILSTIWIAGGVLLLLRKPLGYASGLGLLFAGSMLFVALILFLLLGPVLTGAPFALTDVFVVLIIGMSCFIPFILFLRGVLASDTASKKKNAMTQLKTTEHHTWRALYKIGGVAALLAVFVFRRNLGAELALLSNFGIIGGVPTTPLVSAIDWFRLFQENWLIGLTLMNFFDLVEYALLGLVFLALHSALRQTHTSAMIIATTCGMVGITVYFASNQAFAMLALSKHYAAATTDIQRSIYQAAGEALLAVNNPDSIYQGTGIYVSLFLVLFAGLIISVVMLRSDIFSKATAVAGILANAIGLCYFITLALLPAIYWIPHPISAPFRVIWYFLIALRLFKLGKS